MYALQDDSCNQPPQFNGPSHQSWSPPSSMWYTPTVSTSDTSPSHICQEAFDKVTQENVCLSRCVEELVAPVSALLQQSKQTLIVPITDLTSPSSPPAITTPNQQTTVTLTPPVSSLPHEQVLAIVDQAAAADLLAIDSSQKRHSTRSNEILESSTSHPNDMLDTSFDYDTMHHE